MAEPRPKGPGPHPTEVAPPDNPLPRAGWTSLFGRPPPKGMSRRLLELVAAYEAQARLQWWPEARRAAEAPAGSSVSIRIAQ